MTLFIRPAKPTDLPAYTLLVQQTNQKAYRDIDLGLTKDCFSEAVFATDDTQAYLKSKLATSDNKQTWVVVTANLVLGSATIEDTGDSYELSGFYVLPKYQGMGMGTQLWAKVVEFAGDKDITLDIYVHNTKTIDLYKKWGFEIDTERGTFLRHWPEWPDGVQAESLYMRRATPAV